MLVKSHSCKLLILKNDYNPSAIDVHLQSILAAHAILKLPLSVSKQSFKSYWFTTAQLAVALARMNSTFPTSLATSRGSRMYSYRAAICHFGTESLQPIAIAKVMLQFGFLWPDFEFYIVHVDVSVLISINDMDRLGSFFKKPDKLAHSPQEQRNRRSRSSWWTPHLF